MSHVLFETLASILYWLGELVIFVRREKIAQIWLMVVGTLLLALTVYYYASNW